MDVAARIISRAILLANLWKSRFELNKFQISRVTLVLHNDVSMVRFSLPAFSPGFFNRTKEIKEITTILTSPKPHLTVMLGPASSGKTALMRHCWTERPAWPSLSSYSDWSSCCWHFCTRLFVFLYSKTSFWAGVEFIQNGKLICQF